MSIIPKNIIPAPKGIPSELTKNTSSEPAILGKPGMMMLLITDYNKPTDDKGRNQAIA